MQIIWQTILIHNPATCLKSSGEWLCLLNEIRERLLNINMCSKYHYIMIFYYFLIIVMIKTENDNTYSAHEFLYNLIIRHIKNLPAETLK